MDSIHGALDAIQALDRSLGKYPLPPARAEEAEGDPAYAPYSLVDLRARLATFRPSYYRLYLDPGRSVTLTEFARAARALAYGSPEGADEHKWGGVYDSWTVWARAQLAPLELARWGWRRRLDGPPAHADAPAPRLGLGQGRVEHLWCQVCGTWTDTASVLRGSIPAFLLSLEGQAACDSAILDAGLAKWTRSPAATGPSLAEQHVLGCAWRLGPSDLSIFSPPELLLSPPARAQQADSLATALSSTAPIRIGSTSADPHHAAQILWPRGWRLASPGVLVCSLCTREVGLGQYTKPESSVSMDPVALHSDFCPYRHTLVPLETPRCDPIYLADGPHTAAVRLIAEVFGEA